MKKVEFDKFAEEYVATHRNNIRFSGESPEFFADYKIKDMAGVLEGRQRTDTILDFGGGIGTSVPYVRRYFPKALITCLDVSDRSLAIARENFAHEAEFVSFDGTNIPFEASTFDLAFAACVFHHIKPDCHLPLLRKLARVIKPGGWLFVFEHNPLNPFTRYAVNTCPFDTNAVLISGFQMQRLFKATGFGKVTLQYRVFFPGFLSILRGLERSLGWLPLGGQYYVCGQRVG